ncbi:MAG: hypothetical protein Q7J10_05585 [Methanosarcinaceae archaeon]|nr:hypothetical protein [Methanosarcinaceae archaeon]
MSIKNSITPARQRIAWQPSAKEEIIDFYTNRFERIFAEQAPDYVKDIGNISEWACVSYEGIFVRGIDGKGIQFNTFEDLRDFLLDNIAKAAYYGTGALFTVDIDAKDVAKTGLCELHPKFEDYEIGSAEYNTRLEYVHNIPPRGYDYCFNCIKIAVDKIYQIHDILVKIGADPETISLWFSGQGAHLECNDPDMMDLNKDVREFIASYLSLNGMPIDKVITYGQNRVFRVPGSLHGNVGRVKTRLELGEEISMERVGVVVL